MTGTQKKKGYIMNKKGINRFFLYLLRWEMSSPILALCLHLLHFNTLTNTIIANLIGGCMFYFIDKNIFTKGDKSNDK